MVAYGRPSGHAVSPGGSLPSLKALRLGKPYRLDLKICSWRVRSAHDARANSIEQGTASVLYRAWDISPLGKQVIAEAVYHLLVFGWLAYRTKKEVGTFH